MQSPERPIKLTLTETIVCAMVSGVFALGCFALLIARLQKHGVHGGADWIASAFLLFALLNLERTIKFAILAVRTRRLDLQTRRMEQHQKRAGWLE